MQNILGAAGRQDRLYGQFDSWFVTPGMGQAVDRREFDRPNDRFFGECDFHPVGIVFPRRRKLHRSVGFSFYEFFSSRQARLLRTSSGSRGFPVSSVGVGRRR